MGAVLPIGYTCTPLLGLKVIVILPWKLSLQDGLLELQSIPIVTERVKLIRVKPAVTDFQQFPDDLTHLATLEVLAEHGLVRVGRKCYPVYGRDNKRDKLTIFYRIELNTLYQMVYKTKV